VTQFGTKCIYRYLVRRSQDEDKLRIFLKKTAQVREQVEEFATLSRHMPCVHPRLHTGNEDRNCLVTALVADVERNAQTAQQKRSVDRVSAIIRAAICEGSQLLGC
jgi:hypothetical protein